MGATMKVFVLIAAMAVATVIPITFVSFSTEAAAETRQERLEREREQRRAAAERQRNRESLDAARANDLDPAGDYKGYPDWARAALSPKGRVSR